MASYDDGGATPRDASRAERTTPGLRGAPADRSERPVRTLPGVVNDLPEVAPHEWIYLMS